MAAPNTNYDFLIVGGGVIGLSLAWELAQHQARVCVVDRGPLGKEASWAGAGMVPPGAVQSHWKIANALEQLEGYSQTLHGEWHKKLLDLTGIDNEYRQCGGIQLALDENEAAALDEKVARWQALGIDCQSVDRTTLADLEPAMASRANDFVRAYCLPVEAQIRNPRYLQALVAACRSAGVELRPQTQVADFEITNGQVTEVNTDNGSLHTNQVCLASGSWSGLLASKLGLELPIRPIRGQIALLDGQPEMLKRNINVGARYLVPRADGHLLIGSTQEDVGFDKQTTDDGINGLRKFAASVCPATENLPVSKTWSGLRPGTGDGLPYLGRLSALDNAWLATGHFRAGLQLSPATATVMRALMLGQQPPIDVAPLSMSRPISFSGDQSAVSSKRQPLKAPQQTVRPAQTCDDSSLSTHYSQ